MAGGTGAAVGGLLVVTFAVALGLLVAVSVVTLFMMVGLNRSIRAVQRDLARVAVALDHLATRLRDDETRSHTMSSEDMEARRQAALARLGEGSKPRQEEEETEVEGGENQ